MTLSQVNDGCAISSKMMIENKTMQFTIKEIRSIVRRAILEALKQSQAASQMSPHELYNDIEFKPREGTFHDRWGHQLPRSPESLNPAAVAQWIKQNRVESVTVGSKKLSSKAFISKLSQKPEPMKIVMGQPDLGKTG